MLFDTHCHLTIDPLHLNINNVVESAKKAGVTQFVIPAVDVESSKRAVEIASEYEGVYAAVGIHPEIITDDKKIDIAVEVKKIEEMLGHQKIVALGEIGLDRHMYSHYLGLTDNAKIQQLMSIQAMLLKEQIQLASQHNLSVILHSRNTATELISVLDVVWEARLSGRVVFHCCEVSEELLVFAKQHAIFIGVDGDLTWSKKKQRFIKEVPLELLVLETDSPYLTPEPVKKQQNFPNEPKNIVYVRDAVALIKELSVEEIERVTTENAKRLFNIKNA